MAKQTLKDRLNRWKTEQRLAAEATLERPERYPVCAVEWARRVLGKRAAVTQSTLLLTEPNESGDPLAAKWSRKKRTAGALSRHPTNVPGR